MLSPLRNILYSWLTTKSYILGFLQKVCTTYMYIYCANLLGFCFLIMKLHFRSNEFIIRMSRDTLATLKRHLQEKKQSITLNIIQEHLYFDMYEGVSRTKAQIDSVAGAVIGEATRQG